MGFLKRHRALGIPLPETPREFTTLTVSDLEEREYTPRTLRAIVNLATRLGWEQDAHLRASMPVLVNRLLEWEPNEDTFFFLETHLRGSELYGAIQTKIASLRSTQLQLAL